MKYSPEKIKLIVGLGNPGNEYAKSRHNIGWLFIDSLIEHDKGNSFKDEKKFNAQIARCDLYQQTIFLMKPMTYMNLSGQSVGSFAQFYKIKTDEILVVHDDMDLLCGQVKMKKGGSSGGHNGLKDIERVLPTSDFWRLRLGIGHPRDKGDVINYVLKAPLWEEKESIDEAIILALKVFPLIIESNFEEAIRILHSNKIKKNV